MQQPAADALELVDLTFRTSGERILLRLVAHLGEHNAAIAEDAVQDAFIAGLRAWPQSGLPSDAPAWIYTTARNRALDLIKRENRSDPIDDDRLPSPGHGFTTELMDDELRMLFMCCHPRLSSASRVALALNIVGGLSAAQIARALLLSESAVRQSIVRSKRRLREEAITLELPTASELEGRLDSVLSSIYLMFNEGYSALEGESVVRIELCNEAIRMCGLLTDAPATDFPPIHALAALMLFQGARLAARAGDGHQAITLRNQDRNRWDMRMIALAFSELERSAEGSAVSTYHLEAEIASYHARSETYEGTNWSGIIAAYDALIELNPSPVVRLARAVAVGERDGSARGLAVLEELRSDHVLSDYPFFHAARAELLKRVGRVQESREAYTRALALSVSAPVRRNLAEQLESQCRIPAC